MDATRVEVQSIMDIFNTSIPEAHYLCEKVHTSAILICTYPRVIEEQKYEQTFLE